MSLVAIFGTSIMTGIFGAGFGAIWGGYIVKISSLAGGAIYGVIVRFVYSMLASS